MPIRQLKPVTPWQRKRSVLTFEELTTNKPYKPLTIKLKKHSWRSSNWRITVRHKWWGHAKKYRIIDFLFKKHDIPAKIETIEYDPYRSAFISLICYNDWERKYIIAHKDMKVWDRIIISKKTKIIPWNRMEIENIPTWVQIHNIEAIVWEGSKYARSAWTYWTIVSQEWVYTQVKFPSWEVRYINKRCYASIGVVSNIDHNQVRIWKAWRSRWMWIRPTVLWKSMNPVDHPHWWWEWHQPLGMAPKTPWGKLALWVKTRRKKFTNKWIAKKRV